MIWFGSSAGVALSNMFPEARSVGLWLRHGWHVAFAYVIGFFVLFAVLGWQPQEKRVRATVPTAPSATMPMTTPAPDTAAKPAAKPEAETPAAEPVDPMKKGY